MRQLNGWLERVLDREASTRSAALLRIGLAVIAFSRFGSAMMLGPQVGPAQACVIALFWVATVAMLLGFHAQLATGATVVAMIAAGPIVKAPGWSHHHVSLLISATALIAFTPCGRSYSLDRWRALARADERGLPPPAELGRLGMQTLIAVQLSAVYFWGAFDKCTLGWLRGDKLESQLLFHVFDSDPPDVPGWRALMLVLAVGTVLLELALAVGLWLPRARRWLIPAGIVLHLSIYIALPVTVFSALSCLLYLAYFDPDEVHRVIDRLSGVA
ncbi:MAG TPA: HTTM domain-containing protein [Polyangiales bacterium]|nr:HTTM domain-containing protein [Polyangiales bacterium]